MNMANRYQIPSCALVLSAMGVSVIAQPRLFLTLQGDDPSATTPGTNVEIIAAPGDTLVFDVWLEDLGAGFAGVRGYQLDAPCIATGGDTGSIDFLVDSLFVGEDRPAWLYLGISSLAVVDAGDCPYASDPRVAVVTTPNPVRPPGPIVTTPQYLAEFDFEVSYDAGGVFEIQLVCLSSDNCPVDGTYLLDDDNGHIEPLSNDGANVAIGFQDAPSEPVEDGFEEPIEPPVIEEPEDNQPGESPDEQDAEQPMLEEPVDEDPPGATFGESPEPLANDTSQDDDYDGIEPTVEQATFGAQGLRGGGAPCGALGMICLPMMLISLSFMKVAGARIGSERRR